MKELHQMGVLVQWEHLVREHSISGKSFVPNEVQRAATILMTNIQHILLLPQLMQHSICISRAGISEKEIKQTMYI